MLKEDRHGYIVSYIQWKLAILGGVFQLLTLNNRG